MVPVRSTAEILAYKILNRLTDNKWLEWAYQMLLAGFETESLLILAGMSRPLEYFEMRNLTDKVLQELQIDYSAEDSVIENYASYLAQQSLSGEIKPFYVLDKLKDIHTELDYYSPLSDFYSLYFAWVDLQVVEDQWYINGVDRSNIDQAITDCFKLWSEKS